MIDRPDEPIQVQVQPGINPWIQLVGSLGRWGLFLAGMIFITDQFVDQAPKWIMQWSTLESSIAAQNAENLAKSESPDTILAKIDAGQEISSAEAKIIYEIEQVKAEATRNLPLSLLRQRVEQANTKLAENNARIADASTSFANAAQELKQAQRNPANSDALKKATDNLADKRAALLQAYQQRRKDALTQSEALRVAELKKLDDEEFAAYAVAVGKTIPPQLDPQTPAYLKYLDDAATRHRIMNILESVGVESKWPDTTPPTTN